MVLGDPGVDEGGDGGTALHMLDTVTREGGREGQPVQVVCSAFHACANDPFSVERIHDAADADSGLANDLPQLLGIIWRDNLEL